MEVRGVFGPLPQCPVEKPCLRWVQVYLLDCVCSTRDRFSLALGLMSVASWGVAEVPQILTNFREKSTEGVSLIFLMTWVVGDVFNLMGCYLEPATLPTQFYMAILYTLTTIILVLQTIYCEHVARWWAGGRVEVEDLFPEIQKTDMEAQKPIRSSESVAISGGESISPQLSQPTSIRVPHHHHVHGCSDQLYIQSARSLASSYAQPIGSYNVAGSRGSTGGHHHSYLLTREDSEHMAPLVTARSRRSSSSSISTSVTRTAASGVLLVGSLGISLYTNPRTSSGGGSVVGTTHSGRGGNMWLGDPFLGEEPSPLGEVFGWIMACIYMGGRLPQIWLNIQRGTVEGLNPLMFVFALLGNITYVGSILVRSMDWAQLKPNLAWLVDAGVCVLLDIFILCQFVYYYSKAKVEDTESSEEETEPYKPLN